MSDETEIIEETRYFLSFRSFKHFKVIRQELFEKDIISDNKQAVYVTLSDKHRKIVLKTIKLPVPMSHMIGQWRKSELKKLSENSSEPYNEELITKQQAWMDNLMDRYNLRRKMIKRRSLL